METPATASYQRSLIIILTLYFLLTLVSTLCTPLFRGPDEPAHVIYVRSLAHFKFPGLSHEETNDISGGLSHEAHQPPLYYVIAAPVAALVDSVRALRVVSIILGMLWIYLVYLLTSEFFGRDGHKSLYATAFAAFLPMSSYIAGVVNNDIMICVTFTWTLWIMTKAMRQGSLDRRSALWLGLSSGAAVLSKAQGLLLLPLILLFMVLLRPKEQGQRRQNIRNSLTAFVIALAVGSVWFIRNTAVYGTPFIQSLYHPITTLDVFVSDPLRAVGVVSAISRQLFQYFWAPFWVIDQFINVDKNLYINLLLSYTAFWFAVTALAVIGLSKRIFRLSCDNNQRSTENRLYLLYVSAAVLIYISVIYQTLFIDRGVLQQGRLFLPLAGALGIALVQGFSTLLASPKTRRLTAAAGLLILIAMNLTFSYAVHYNYKYIETGSPVANKQR